MFICISFFIWFELICDGLALPTLDDVSNDDGFGENIHISPDGQIWRSQQRRVDLDCPMNLTSYPFDTQSCTWLLGVYSEHAEEVHVQWRVGRDGLEDWEDACTAGWTPTGMSQQNLLQRWPSGNYSYAKATIELTRTNAGEIMISYFVTSIILVLVGFLGMFIDPSAMPARVGLGTIVILTTLSNYWSLLGRMPAGGNDTQPAWLARFLYASFIFNVVCFVEQIALNYARMAHKWAIDRETQRYGRVAPAEGAAIKAEEPVVTAESAAQQSTPSSAPAPADEAQAMRISRRRSISESIVAVAVEAPEQTERRMMVPFLKCLGHTLPRVEHWFRFVLPLAYLIVVVVFLSEVNYGRSWWARFEAMESMCVEGRRVVLAGAAT